MKTRFLLLIIIVIVFNGCKKNDDSGDNLKPTIEFINPVDHVTIQKNEFINIVANASDADGKIVQVSFYINNLLEYTDNSEPYSFETSFPNTGQYEIAVKAMDNNDASATAGPLFINVTSQGDPGINISYSPSYSIKEFDDIEFTVNIDDQYEPVENVDFYINDTHYGSDASYPYVFIWDSVPAGTHNFYTIATENDGNTIKSSYGSLVVYENYPPTIEFYYPQQNQKFSPGEKIRFYFSVQDMDGSVDTIKVFANSSLIATLIDENEYYWEDVPSGDYTLSAIAIDNNGTWASSENVDIEILPGIITEGVVSDLVYSENDELVFGLNQDRNKLLLINPTEGNMSEIDLPYSQPIAMQYSIPDKKLYIIYKFSGVISIWDNNSQSLSTMTFSTNGDGLDISIDQNNRRVYVLATTGLYILDMDNGSILLDGESVEGVTMVLDPLNQNLFTAFIGGSPSRCYKYSVVNDELSLLQYNSDMGGNARQLNIHPEFDYLVLPCGGGNGPGYTLYAYDTDDLENVFGEFDIGTYPAYATFTADGSTLFGVNGDPYDNNIYVMDAHNYTRKELISFPNSDNYAVLTPNYSGNKIIAFSYDTYDESNYVIYFFDLD